MSDYFHRSEDGCPKCKSKNIKFVHDDYDYDGNDRVHSWDVYYCFECEERFQCNRDDPYEKEEPWSDE